MRVLFATENFRVISFEGTYQIQSAQGQDNWIREYEESNLESAIIQVEIMEDEQDQLNQGNG